MTQYFPKPYEPFRGNINVKVGVSDYATKDNLKDAAGADTSKLALKSNLENLKAEIDKIDVGKLKNVPSNLSNLKNKIDKLDVFKLAPVPVDLSKLSDAVKNDVVKNDVYNTKIK